MKTFKTVGLTLLLTIGLLIPSCHEDPCDGVVFRHFFDIAGIDIANYSDYSNYGEGTEILPNDTISFDELDKVYIDYMVDYVVHQSSKRDWLTSLMPMANACSYFPGGSGSKEEKLLDFSIITLNDFDTEHLAGSNINDLFDYHGSQVDLLDNPMPLTQFLEEQTENIQEEDMVLSLKKAPELEQEFKVKVVMELSTEEVYEVESEPIFISL